MVSSAPGSRPAELTQADVDDLVRGDHGRITEARRTASPQASSAARAGDADGGRPRPADLSPKEIEAIRRTGRPSAGVAKRLAAAERVETATAGRGRSKAAKRAGTAPSTSPPGYE